MRPIRDIFIEEYWTVLYRKAERPEDGVFGHNPNAFIPLKASAEYWYADTFLFEKDGELFLFVESFDNKTELGTIAVSVMKNGRFSQPKEVLKEPFHLSYPFVFEENGTIYMMPETNSDNCIQVYRAEHFPDRWVRDHVIVKDVRCVDTVIYQNWLITGSLCPANDKSLDLLLFDRSDGTPHKMNPIRTSSFDDRGGGPVVYINGRPYRPVQDCRGGVYGQKLIFKEITECDENRYADTEVFALTPDMLPVAKMKPIGVHTYSFLNGYEVVDVKLRRWNTKRVWWIIKKKIFK